MQTYAFSFSYDSLMLLELLIQLGVVAIFPHVRQVQWLAHAIARSMEFKTLDTTTTNRQPRIRTTMVYRVLDQDGIHQATTKS